VRAAEAASDWPAALRPLHLIEHSKPIDPAKAVRKSAGLSSRTTIEEGHRGAHSHTSSPLQRSSEQARLMGQPARAEPTRFPDLDRAEARLAQALFQDARTLLVALKYWPGPLSAPVELRLGATDALWPTRRPEMLRPAPRRRLPRN
jgi:hypothetical protein